MTKINGNKYLLNSIHDIIRNNIPQKHYSSETLVICNYITGSKWYVETDTLSLNLKWDVNETVEIKLKTIADSWCRQSHNRL